MENRRIEVTVNKNDGVSKADLAQAKKKRMLLSEVYVHKTRKIDKDSNNEDEFEVFHIFEFADDATTKITPKLSTNCTEPRKIIDVLQNSTGSDTPQLERLIEKLCAQSMYWSFWIILLAANMIINYYFVLRLFPDKRWAETKENQTGQTPTATTAAATTASMAPMTTATAATANNTHFNKTGTTTQSARGVNVPALMQSSPASHASPYLATITRVTKSSNAQTTPSSPVQSQAMDIPMIRCKTFESLKETNGGNTQHQAVAKKRVTMQQQQPVKKLIPIAPNPNKPSLRTYPAVESQPSAKQPIKLWNNVMQQKENPPVDVLFTLRNCGSDTNGSVNQLHEQTLQIENATENSSTLKINQVFEGVSEHFGENFLLDQTVEVHTQSPSPLLDNLVKEIASDKQPNDACDVIALVKDSDERCADYRCNICLVFNDSFTAYKVHMAKSHGFNIICSTCHNGFANAQSYTYHIRVSGGSVCELTPKSNRPFICIVDPPISLMRNQKVFAFRCKYCTKLAFQNQRNYVQHAQRHAKWFRCKLCPTKPLSSSVMQQHLLHHHA